MAIEADFKEFMTQTVTIEPYASQNKFGEPSYGTGVKHSARTVKKTKLVRTAEGKEVVSTAQTWIYGSPAVTTQDRITLPDGSKPVILSLGGYPDESGDHHLVIYT